MLIVLPLVVIHDLDVPYLTFAPPETNPPLIINADAMLTASVTVQGFETVAWRDLKVIDLLCRVDGKKFGSCTALYLVGNAPNRVASVERDRTFVGEALDHYDGAYRITVRMSI
jgi:hypothetical protein